MTTDVLYKINFKSRVTHNLGFQRRKPKWIATLYSYAKPYEIYYAEFLGLREKLLRRMYCDGSVIAMKKLVLAELGLEIEILDGTGDNEQADIEMWAGLEDEVPLSYIGLDSEENIVGVPLENESRLYDYTVIILTPVADTVKEEMRKRVDALFEIYNSAGFIYQVIYNG